MSYKNGRPIKLLAVLFFCINGIAQSPHEQVTVAGSLDTTIRLKDIIRLSEQRYHLLQSKKYEAEAADKNTDVVRYSRLPSIEATYQTGIATANNLTGLFYPNSFLPLTGPPSLSNNYSAATGSAASLLLNWQAVTFGQRNAQINLSIAEANAQKSAYQRDLLNHTINVISIYLDVLLAYDVVNITRHNRERVQTNLRQSRILANSGIKPGVDTALFLSELSKAKITSLNAQKQLQTEQWLLAQVIVTDALPVPADTSFLHQLPAVVILTDTSFAAHPAIRYAQDLIRASESKEQLLKKSWLPKLNVWGTGFARGSGFSPDGSIKTWDGLGLSRYNYGAGVQLAFPIMKYGEAKRQVQQQSILSKASQERLMEDKDALTTQQHIANITFQNSIAVAGETEEQLKSGKYAFNAILIRYNTGLVNFSDLIQVQYNLLKAELDVKEAHWNAWKALLLQAAVKGDVNYFLNEIR